MSASAQKQVVFIQNAIPPLRDGAYLLNAVQNIPQQNPSQFGARCTFVVQGERFAIRPTEIDSAFPPNLANGEFDGVLPHVVFTRRTLPWEREINTPGSANSYDNAPWLAVLLCDAATAPELQSVTAKDLVPAGTTITVVDSTITGTGTLVTTTLSYGAAVLGQLGYGETPDDPCTVIDLPVTLFNQIAPAAADMAYLAHIREVDTTDGVNSESTSAQFSVVVGNRIPPSNGAARAFLVSLEGMADYLPAANGTQSSKVGASIDTVRLIAYQSWSFTTNDMDQTLEKLLENLNTPPPGGTRITTLTLPITGNAPTATQVAQALANQAAGKLSNADATVLMQNALLMGYVPFNHHLRHGGNTVSFYRGPLAPIAVPASGPAYYSCPDAANAYNPQTGLFDVSYGAAWQLGQLLALQSAGMANQLYNWKRSVTQQQAMATESALLAQRLQGAPVFASFLGRWKAAATDGPPALPDDVTNWFRNLVNLQGVPFNYLVPDERLLPPESIRFFYLDENWVDALVDGAFSIGRTSASASTLEATHAPPLRRAARAGRYRFANRRVAAPQAGAGTGPVTGCLIRSQAISGWPNLRSVGYSDPDATAEIPLISATRLSGDTMLCLFEGVLASLYLREPPEQLHHGIQGAAGGYFAALRSVFGGPGSVVAGQPYTTAPTVRKTSCDPTGSHPWTCIPMRSDGRTVIVSDAASAIQDRLSQDYQQSFTNGFTSAEFALEMAKGVVEVEYSR